MVKSYSEHAKLTQDFQALGFTDYEGKVYVALLQESPATAYEISKLNGLIRANVYGALEGLERKNAVQRVNLDPVKYVPVEPRTLLDRISRTVADRCADLLQRFDAVKAEPDDTEYVWTVKQKSDAAAKIHDMLGKARKHIWMKGHEAELEPYLDSLRKAADSGVAVLLVVFGDPERFKSFDYSGRIRVYPHEGNGTVVGFGRDIVIVTVDFEEALIVNMREVSGSYTRSRPVVNLFDSFIRHEIYLAEIFGKLGEQIEEHFGPALLSLRKDYLPAVQIKELEISLANGENKPVKRAARAARQKAPAA